MMRRFIPLAVFISISGLLWYGLGLNPSLVPSPLIGKPVPAFELPLLDDERTTFAHTDLAGEITMIHVWATWCVSCRAEHPTLLAFSRRGLVPVIGLNYKDERGPALRWLRDLGDPYRRTLYDPAGRVGLDLGVYGTPETFLVDRDGIIRFKHVGPLTPALIENRLVPLIMELRGGT